MKPINKNHDVPDTAGRGSMGLLRRSPSFSALMPVAGASSDLSQTPGNSCKPGRGLCLCAEDPQRLHRVYPSRAPACASGSPSFSGSPDSGSACSRDPKPEAWRSSSKPGFCLLIGLEVGCHKVLPVLRGEGPHSKLLGASVDFLSHCGQAVCPWFGAQCSESPKWHREGLYKCVAAKTEASAKQSTRPALQAYDKSPGPTPETQIICTSLHASKSSLKLKWSLTTLSALAVPMNSAADSRSGSLTAKPRNTDDPEDVPTMPGNKKRWRIEA